MVLCVRNGVVVRSASRRNSRIFQRNFAHECPGAGGMMFYSKVACLACSCYAAIAISPLFAAGPDAAPAAVKGCVLWLRADAGVVADGAGKISRWLDQSGQGHDVDRMVGSAPVLATGINQKPVVR